MTFRRENVEVRKQQEMSRPDIKKSICRFCYKKRSRLKAITAIPQIKP